MGTSGPWSVFFKINVTLQGDHILYINDSEGKEVSFPLSTSCIKLCEILFGGLVRIDFLHVFFPGNKTRRETISKRLKHM